MIFLNMILAFILILLNYWSIAVADVDITAKSVATVQYVKSNFEPLKLWKPINKKILRYISQGTIAPVIINDKLIILDIKGNLYLVSNDLKKTYWKIKLTNNKKYYSGSLSYINNSVFCIINNFLYEIDINTGIIKWQKEFRNIIMGDPFIDLKSHSIALLTLDNYLYLLDYHSKSILWSYQGLATEFHHLNSTSPAGDGEIIIVPFSDGQVIAFDFINGNKLWSYKMPSNIDNIITDIQFTPSVGKSNVLVINKAQGVNSLKMDSGKVAWSKKLAVSAISSVIEDKVFAIVNNSIIALDINTGNVLWKNKLNLAEKNARHIKWNKPVLVDNKLWISSNTGILLQLNCKFGNIEKIINIPYESYHSPVIKDSSLYITSTGKGLVLISLV